MEMSGEEAVEAPTCNVSVNVSVRVRRSARRSVVSFLPEGKE